MRSGKRDRLISIYTVNDFGGGRKDITSFTTAWAERILSGREIYLAQQKNTEINAVFLIPYIQGITASMKIQCDGTEYDIQYVEELRRRRGLKIMAIGHEERDQF